MQKGSRRVENHINSDEELPYPWPILTLPPLKRNKHVVLDMCSPSGDLERQVVSSNNPSHIYKAARKSYWGGNLVVKPKIYGPIK